MSRVVAITGIGSSTAQATAREFAQRGEMLALLSRSPQDVEAATSELRILGARVVGVVVDTTDPDAVESAVDLVEDELGPVDVWVNTAEDSGEMPFGDLCPAVLRDITERSYLGHVHTTMTAVERMEERGRGTVVHVVGELSVRGQARRAALSGAQAALRGFHESLDAELRSEGSEVRAVLVRQPEGVEAQETAEAVVRAATAPLLASSVVRAGAPAEAASA